MGSEMCIRDRLNTSKVYKVVSDGTYKSYNKQQRIRKSILKKHARKEEKESKAIAKKGSAPKYDSRESDIWNR